MKTNSKITVVAIVGILVGYALGSVIGWTDTSGNLGNGDISKVSKFHKATLGSQASALEEKLKSDTLAFNQESAMVDLINSRMTDFADLVDYTIIAASDKAELSEEVNSLVNVRDLSANAVQAGKIAAASLEYLESGEKNELVADYEQASQNLVVAFMMVDRQVQLGKQFVAATDEYLSGKSLDDVPEIALVRDLWAEYCAESAWLNGDKQEMAYWGEKTTIASSDIVSKGVQALGTSGKTMFGSNYTIGLQSNNTTGLQSNHTTGLQSNHTIGLQSNYQNSRVELGIGLVERVNIKSGDAQANTIGSEDREQLGSIWKDSK